MSQRDSLNFPSASSPPRLTALLIFSIFLRLTKSISSARAHSLARRLRCASTRPTLSAVQWPRRCPFLCRCCRARSPPARCHSRWTPRSRRRLGGRFCTTAAETILILSCSLSLSLHSLLFFALFRCYSSAVPLFVVLPLFLFVCSCLVSMWPVFATGGEQKRIFL